MITSSLTEAWPIIDVAGMGEWTAGFVSARGVSNGPGITAGRKVSMLYEIYEIRFVEKGETAYDSSFAICGFTPLLPPTRLDLGNNGVANLDS